jgi:hypothetical protein
VREAKLPQRRSVSRELRAQVMAEFNHRCAVCGADRPQLHHIDEDPSNNASENLLPLCPNCHLSDQHNPTASIDALKLRLFRQYKDPVILCPQFHPLFLRMRYLLVVDEYSDLNSAEESGKELVAFINALAMGNFYHTRVHELIRDTALNVFSTGEPDEMWRRQMRESAERFRQRLMTNRGQAIDLIIEMLRYQDWHSPVRAAQSAT